MAEFCKQQAEERDALQIDAEHDLPDKLSTMLTSNSTSKSQRKALEEDRSKDVEGVAVL